MSERTYLQLPINADDGFPQSFRLAFNDALYRLLLYVNVLEDEDSYNGGSTRPNQVYDLPQDGAYMVLRVTRERLGGSDVVMHRKLVPDLDYIADGVAFVFKEMRVDRRNLNGIGQFGSKVIGGIASL